MPAFRIQPELSSILSELQGEVVENLKTQELYFVSHFSRHSETFQLLVNYSPLEYIETDYDKIPIEDCWSRPLEVFLTKFSRTPSAQDITSFLQFQKDSRGQKSDHRRPN
jgi:hypothetical protein